MTGQKTTVGNVTMAPEDNDSHRLETDTDDGLLVIVSGPSGVGKTTITRGLERRIGDAVFSVSWTTRDKTEKDTEGVDYHFATPEEFSQLKIEDGFYETARIYGRYYGTPRAWVDEQLRRGRVVILEIDVEGAKQIKSKLPSAFALFVLPPSEDVLLGRLRDRKREGEDQIQKRFGEAQREMAEARDCGVYDRFVTNDDLDRAIDESVAAVELARATPRPQRTSDV
ncbi:MAG: guanylate kinase [Planctomycetota bacterium]